MALPSHIARYTVVQPIAAGGMGEVFLARDEKLDRLVAIKLLREGFDSADLHQRFEEEARNVAKLTHPNIVTIYEFGTHETRPYIAMEYIAGHSLAEIIKRQLPLSVARRVRLIEEVCSGLAHAHKAHLVHRDVKPANLMMTTSGLVKVLDFGIAKLRGTDRTQKGMIVGTVNYMSPEQITGQPVDHRSDVFAVGAVLYEVLTYEQAFKGDLTTAMFGIVHGQPDPLSKRCPGLDPAFQSVLDKCLAKSPDDRYQDLSQLKRDLGRLRRPLEEAEDADVSDTVAPLDLDQTIVVKTPKPASTLDGKGVGPDTRRALGSALAAGEAAMTAGQFESAIRYAEQALALESQNVSAHDLLSRASKAREAERVAAQVKLAKDALGGDRLDDARAALDAATAIAPESNTVRELVQQVEQRAADLDRFDRTVVLARERFEARDFGGARDLAETIAHIRPGASSLQRLRDEIAQADAQFKAWLKTELAAIDELVGRQDFAGALARAEAAAAKAPLAPELAARASQVRAARDAVLRAEDARRREADEKHKAEEARATRIAALLDQARRTTEPLPARRDAAAELLKLEPRHEQASALLAEITADIAAAEKQRAIEQARAAADAEAAAKERAFAAMLAAAEASLGQGQFDAADAKAAEAAKARPDDARVAKVRTAIADARKKHDQRRAAIAAAEKAAAAGRHAEAITQLEALDTRDQAVAAALERVRAEAAAEVRRQQRAAQQARLRALATDRRVVGGLGAAAILALAVWLWPTTAPDQAESQPEDAVSTGQTTGAAETGGGTGATAGGGTGGTGQPSDGGAAGPDGPVDGKGTVVAVDGGKPGEKPGEKPPEGPKAPLLARVGVDVAEPRKLRHVEPTYPPDALAQRIEGTVTADLTVGLDGAVTDVRIRKSVPGLDQAARAALVQWRYSQSQKDGQRVPVLMTVDVRFTLPPAIPTGGTSEPGEKRPESAGAETTSGSEVPGPGGAVAGPPPPPPPPPKVDEETALRQADLASLNALVGRFGAAYQGKDPAGLKSAWPGMSRETESAYRNVFQSYSRLAWTLQGAESSFSTDRSKATTICSVQVALTELRSSATRTERRSYRFTFERRANGWTLVNVENLGAVR